MASDPRVGTQLGPYRIESVLGRGGMGVIYLAEHVDLSRKVALKILPPELGGDEEFRTRFRRESRIAASLDHPHIVPVHDAGERDGLLYISMRYVPGTDLEVVLGREGGLDPQRVVSIISQVADALDEAHAAGLIHRDVKPSNILLTASKKGEHAYLTDFGIARQTAAATQLTKAGGFLGTIRYAAPEQFMGGELDGRADVYSLGCVTFECLTGRIPFERPSEPAMMFAHMQDPPPSATEIRPELPGAVDGVIARAMAKRREERFETAGELARGLRAAMEGPADVSPRSTPPLPPAATRVPGPAPAPSRRRLWIALGVGAAALAAAIVVMLSLGGSGDDPPAAPPPQTFRAAGGWQATDAADNSHMTLTIEERAPGEFFVRLHDDSVSVVCPGEAVTTEGVGARDGNNVVVAPMRGTCASGTPFEVRRVTFTYSGEDDTIVDDINPGTTWTRVG